MKWQLEDLAFAVLHPKRYAEIEQMVLAARAGARALPRRRCSSEVRARLAELHIDAEVTGRPKHYWSIYEKMVVRGKEFDEIHDLVGVRVDRRLGEGLLRARSGSIHALWRPVQGRFKDYIAMPKFNLYQSLHTTVVGPAGQAGRGADPHAARCTGAPSTASPRTGATRSSATRPRTSSWLQRIVDWQQETDRPGRVHASLKIDLEQDEVFVFTPKGEVITLPTGATPVDFAYAIHTEVGHRCIGARVNGRLVPLDSTLASGDTSRSSPARSRARARAATGCSSCTRRGPRSKIRQWFSRERRDDAIDNGREELVKALRREGLPVQKLARLDVARRGRRAR